MIDYKLAKALKEAGFPQISNLFYGRNELWDERKQNYVVAMQSLRELDTCWDKDELLPDSCVIPTLPELIEACGDKLMSLSQISVNKVLVWRAEASEYDLKDVGIQAGRVGFEAKTPEEAVAKLWLKLNE